MAATACAGRGLRLDWNTLADMPPTGRPASHPVRPEPAGCRLIPPPPPPSAAAGSAPLPLARAGALNHELVELLRPAVANKPLPVAGAAAEQSLPPALPVWLWAPGSDTATAAAGGGGQESTREQLRSAGFHEVLGRADLPPPLPLSAAAAVGLHELEGVLGASGQPLGPAAEGRLNDPAAIAALLRPAHPPLLRPRNATAPPPLPSAPKRSSARALNPQWSSAGGFASRAASFGAPPAPSEAITAILRREVSVAAGAALLPTVRPDSN